MNLITDFLTSREGSSRRDLSLLFLAFAIAFFQLLGRLPLIDPDESRYAEIPREMLELGDFITPHLNYVKYFEKPPLHYWLNALSFSVFGQNEFAARFAGTLCGLLGVLLTYHLGRKLFGRRQGLLAALILGTATGYLVQARINFTDMTLTFCLTACLGFYVVASRDNEPHKRLYYYLFYIFAALAVLAKGLIGIVLPGAVIFFYLLASRRWRLLKEMRLATGILLFLLVCAPWFILVSLQNPEFPRFFFIHEHFQRFLTKVHERYQPFWYFIPVLIGTMLPWSFFIPGSLGGIWRERKLPQADARLFLVLWTAVIFIFFSKSNSKLIPYILPIFPALALLMGETFARAFDRESLELKISGYLFATVFTLVGAALILYPHLSPRPQLTPVSGLVMGTIFLLEGTLSFIALRKGQMIAMFTAICCCSYLLGIVGPPLLLERIAAKRTMKELALLVREKAEAGALVVSYNGYDQSLPFYSQRRVAVVGDMGELRFGSEQGDQSAWFMDRAGFNRLWDSTSPLYVLIDKQELDQLRHAVKTPVTILGAKGNKVLITNR